MLVGIAAFFYLTDSPEKATWLAPDKRAWLTETMARERAERVTQGHGSVLESLRSGKLWLLCAIYMMNTTVTYGVFLWLPRILRDASKDSGLPIGWLTALPFVVALAGMVLVGRHSDRTGERKWHVAVCALVAASGLLLAVAFQDNVWMLVLASRCRSSGSDRCSACSGPSRRSSSAGRPPPPASRSSTRWAISAAPSARPSSGRCAASSGNYTSGLLVLAAALVIEAILVASMRLPRPTPAVALATAAARP